MLLDVERHCLFWRQYLLASTNSPSPVNPGQRNVKNVCTKFSCLSSGFIEFRLKLNAVVIRLNSTIHWPLSCLQPKRERIDLHFQPLRPEISCACRIFHALLLQMQVNVGVKVFWKFTYVADQAGSPACVNSALNFVGLQVFDL